MIRVSGCRTSSCFPSGEAGGSAWKGRELSSIGHSCQRCTVRRPSFEAVSFRVIPLLGGSRFVVFVKAASKMTVLFAAIMMNAVTQEYIGR